MYVLTREVLNSLTVLILRPSSRGGSSKIRSHPLTTSRRRNMVVTACLLPVNVMKAVQACSASARFVGPECAGIACALGRCAVQSCLSPDCLLMVAAHRKPPR